MADLFMPALLRTLTNDGHLRSKEKVLVPLSSKVRADVLKRGLLRLISDYTVNLTSAILAFLCAGKINRAAPDCVGWFLYDFKDVTIISVAVWHTRNLKQCLRGETLPKVAHANCVSRVVEVFRDVSMSREFAEVV